MDKLNKVIEIVNGLYAKKNPVIDWNKWVFERHIKVVADWVEKISEKHDCDKESVLAAAYLHDLAYAFTSKNDPDLEEKSERDLNNKIFFEEYREIAKPYYQSIKTVFSL